jgi:hypothetical protein
MMFDSSANAIRLGPGPYGLPYRAGEPNIRHTLWERDPKKAMSLTLLNLAEVWNSIHLQFVASYDTF